MSARLEVTRGATTEYPLAERVRGGWQNGVMFYPDAEVTRVTPVKVVATVTEEMVGRAAERIKPLFVSAGLVDLDAEDYAWDAARAALEAALTEKGDES